MIAVASRSCKLTPLSSASTCCLLHLMVLQLLQPCISSAPTVYLARLAADQLLEPDPQCARRLAYRLFRIFTRRVLRISAISRRGAAAYGDDNTFLFWAKTLWSVRVVFARHDLFTQLFAYTLHPALRKRNVKKIRRAERGSEAKKTTRPGEDA